MTGSVIAIAKPFPRSREASVEFFIFVWITCAVVGGLIGNSKGRVPEGVLLGLFLGIVGVVIIAVLSPSTQARRQRFQQALAASPTPAPDRSSRPCPWCAESIQPAATVCKYCGRHVEPTAPTQMGPAQNWYPDPSGRHAQRWWDGGEWTDWVAELDGTTSEDPLSTTT